LNLAHCNLTLDCIMLSNSSIKISNLHKVFRTTSSPKNLETSPIYHPPEVHCKQKPIDVKRIDMYALGVILFTMLNDKFPFIKSDTKTLIDNQNCRRYHFREPNTAKLSVDCQVMIHVLLEPVCELRWGVEKVMGMKWVSGMREKIGDS
jgi:serine/threonine protein kinase